MFSVPPKFVCTVCHVRVKSKEILEKHMERHKNMTFKLKGKSYKIFSDIYAINILYFLGGKDSKASQLQEKEDVELPSPTYTAKHSLVGITTSSPKAKG